MPEVFRRRRVLAALPIVLVVVAGCGASEGAAEDEEEPYTLESQDDGASRLTVEAEAVDWLGIKSEPTRASASGLDLDVPTAALLYAPDGSTFVYIQAEEHTYDRHAVTVDHIGGQWTTVHDGPEPGTPVVTQGGAELTGMEFGLEDE